MRIGLVLPSLPGYSETFFQYKIKGLKENGHDVILFINNRSDNKPYHVPVKQAPDLSGNIIFTDSLFIFFQINTTVLAIGKDRWFIVFQNHYATCD